MSRRATKAFTLWFLLVICLVPALASTPLVLGELRASEPEGLLAQVASVEDAAVRVRYGLVEWELVGADARDYQKGETVEVFRGDGVAYPDARSVRPRMSRLVPICFVLWLASAALCAAAVFATARMKRTAAPEKAAPLQARPGFDPERKR